MNIDKVNKIEQVAIYCRVSTIEQAEEGYSIDEQERLLRDWCNRMNYSVYKVYSDRGISGKEVKIEKKETRGSVKIYTVTLDGKYWDCISVDDLETGDIATVIKIEGNKLILEKIDN